MSNPDKYKPLSPEELLKLLEQNTNKESAFSESEMDDFEKDAFEGFTAHTSPQEAKVLMEEVNISISKKISGANESQRKNKVIWFSAAASLAVIVIISAVFFKQNKEASVSNIALNDKKEVTAVTPVDEQTGKDAADHTSVANEPALEGAKQKAKEIDKLSELNVTADARSEVAFNTTTVTKETVVNGEEQKETSGFLSQGTKDFSKGSGYAVTESDDAKSDKDLSNAPIVTAEKAEEKKPETKKVADEIVMNDVTVAANSKLEENRNTTITSSDNEVAFDKNREDSYKKAAEKSTKSKANNTTVTTGSSNTVPASVSATANMSLAYYPGNEASIKEFVLNYIKTKQVPIVLKGKYKITATVMPDKTLKVITIKNTTSDCNECIKPITDALNTMKNWEASAEGAKTTQQSLTEFVLSF